MQRQAESTEKAANAAKANADAVISAERAWVMVDIEPPPGIGNMTVSDSSTTVYARMSCWNDGKTPAWIEEIRARFMVLQPNDVLPLIPALDHTEILNVGPILLSVRKEKPFYKDEAMVAEGVHITGSGTMAVLYGVVNYRDVFSSRRQSTFGYWLTSGSKWERLSGCPKYNENT